MIEALVTGVLISERWQKISDGDRITFNVSVVVWSELTTNKV